MSLIFGQQYLTEHESYHVLCAAAAATEADLSGKGTVVGSHNQTRPISRSSAGNNASYEHIVIAVV